MTPAERTAKIAELRAEADRLERGWPDKIERGMVFRQMATNEAYIMSRWNRLVCLTDGGEWAGDQGFSNRENDFIYLGHARDLLTIKTPDAPEVNVEAGHVAIPWQNAGEGDEYMIDGRWWKSGGGDAHPKSPGAYSWRRKTDAPEPTGSELVGKAVHVCDVVNGAWCTESCGAPIIVVEHNPDSTLPYTVQSGNRWKFARLAKEQP